MLWHIGVQISESKSILSRFFKLSQSFIHSTIKSKSLEGLSASTPYASNMACSSQMWKQTGIHNCVVEFMNRMSHSSFKFLMFSQASCCPNYQVLPPCFSQEQLQTIMLNYCIVVINFKNQTTIYLKPKKYY